MADKRITELDDGTATLATTDSMEIDRAGLDETERVTVQQVIEKPTDVSSAGWVLDEDDMSSDSATQVPTQQSTKAYADSLVTASVSFESGAGAPSSTPSSVADIYIDTTADRAYIATDTSSSADWDLIPITGAQIQALLTGLIDLTTDVTGVLPEANGGSAGTDFDAQVAATATVTANTAKTTNATHTGDVTGSGALTVDPTAISGKALVTAVGADHVLILDTTDGALKKALISDFASAGGDMSAATYDPATIAEQLVGLTATQTLTNKTLTQPALTLTQSATPTPTAEGVIEWDTDGNQIKVGDGASTVTFSDDTAHATAAQGATADTALQNVVEDTTPQLGGDLDVNGQAIGDGTNELITFVEDASAVNHLEIENEATGSGPILRATGDDAAVDMVLDVKGDGDIYLGNWRFDAGAAIGAGQDNYVATYDHASGTWGPEAAAGGGLSDVVDDTTPQLGGQLDVNGNAIGDGTNELVTFVEDASAVNNLEIENEATGSGPILRAVGDDANVDLNIEAKGTGNIKLGSFTLDADQTVGAGQDNYVLTYDDAGGLISLEAAAGGGGGAFPSDWVENANTSITLAAGDMNEGVDCTAAAAVTVTVNASTGSVDDQVAVKASGAAGVVLTAGTATFQPPGDVAIAEGQVAHIYQSATDVWEVTAPTPVVTQAEAENVASPGVLSRLWSPLRVHQAVDARREKLDVGAFLGVTDPYGIPGASVSSGAAGAFAYTIDAARYTFFRAPYDLTLTDSRVDVVTGAGTVLRIAVIEMDAADGGMNATGLIGQHTVDPSTAGDKDSTGLSYSLQGGKFYWVASVCDGAATVEKGEFNGNWPMPFASTGSVAMNVFLNASRASVGTSAFADPVDDPNATTYSDNSGQDTLVVWKWTID